jgi:hypothetical protein
VAVSADFPISVLAIVVLSYTMHHESSKMGLARKLAHNDKAVRDSAIDMVVQWLDQRKQLTDLDYLKLWKALYYCTEIYMKP